MFPKIWIISTRDNWIPPMSSLSLFSNDAMCMPRGHLSKFEADSQSRRPDVAPLWNCWVLWDVSGYWVEPYTLKPIHYANAWWRHGMKRFSHHWPFVRGIRQLPVHSPHTRRERRVMRFHCCQFQQAIEQTVEFPVIWDTKILIWRHSNGFGFPRVCLCQRFSGNHTCSSGKVDLFDINVLIDFCGIIIKRLVDVSRPLIHSVRNLFQGMGEYMTRAVQCIIEIHI